MNDTPTLPGTLPGLLQPGCPIARTDWSGQDGDRIYRGWVVTLLKPSPFGESGGVLGLVMEGDTEVEDVHVSRLALDLSRPEGVDRALRWLAARHGFDGPLPPGLAALDSGGKTVAWVLSAYDGWRGEAQGWKRLPHPVGNPIEALRLACLAVGEGLTSAKP